MDASSVPEDLRPDLLTLDGHFKHHATASRPAFYKALEPFLTRAGIKLAQGRFKLAEDEVLVKNWKRIRDELDYDDDTDGRWYFGFGSRHNKDAVDRYALQGKSINLLARICAGLTHRTGFQVRKRMQVLLDPARNARNSPGVSVKMEPKDIKVKMEPKEIKVKTENEESPEEEEEEEASEIESKPSVSSTSREATPSKRRGKVGTDPEELKRIYKEFVRTQGSAVPAATTLGLPYRIVQNNFTLFNNLSTDPVPREYREHVYRNVVQQLKQKSYTDISELILDKSFDWAHQIDWLQMTHRMSYDPSSIVQCWSEMIEEILNMMAVEKENAENGSFDEIQAVIRAIEKVCSRPQLDRHQIIQALVLFKKAMVKAAATNLSGEELARTLRIFRRKIHRNRASFQYGLHYDRSVAHIFYKFVYDRLKKRRQRDIFTELNDRESVDSLLTMFTITHKLKPTNASNDNLTHLTTNKNQVKMIDKLFATIIQLLRRDPEYDFMHWLTKSQMKRLRRSMAGRLLLEERGAVLPTFEGSINKELIKHLSGWEEEGSSGDEETEEEVERRRMDSKRSDSVWDTDDEFVERKVKREKEIGGNLDETKEERKDLSATTSEGEERKKVKKNDKKKNAKKEEEKENIVEEATANDVDMSEKKKKKKKEKKDRLAEEEEGTEETQQIDETAFEEEPVRKKHKKEKRREEKEEENEENVGSTNNDEPEKKKHKKEKRREEEEKQKEIEENGVEPEITVEDEAEKKERRRKEKKRRREEEKMKEERGKEMVEEREEVGPTNTDEPEKKKHKKEKRREEEEEKKGKRDVENVDETTLEESVKKKHKKEKRREKEEEERAREEDAAQLAVSEPERKKNKKEKKKKDDEVDEGIEAVIEQRVEPEMTVDEEVEKKERKKERKRRREEEKMKEERGKEMVVEQEEETGETKKKKKKDKKEREEEEEVHFEPPMNPEENGGNKGKEGDRVVRGEPRVEPEMTVEDEAEKKEKKRKEKKRRREEEKIREERGKEMVEEQEEETGETKKKTKKKKDKKREEEEELNREPPRNTEENVGKRDEEGRLEVRAGIQEPIRIIITAHVQNFKKKKKERKE